MAHLYVCTKCGRKQAASNGVKPGATVNGKCPASKAGTHTWVKA